MTRLVDYFEDWINMYKKGVVRDVTLQKYYMNLGHLRRIAPDIRLEDLNRYEYQKIINGFAATHERVTTCDFNTQLKACVLDAVDDGLVARDPTRKVVIKGMAPKKKKKKKFLSQEELKKVLKQIELDNEPSWGWAIVLGAKTGMRFAEIMGLTKADFDFDRMEISVNKTWDYKEGSGFAPTKNLSSVRKIAIDWKLATQIRSVLDDIEDKTEPIFKPLFGEKGQVYNSTANGILERLCKKAGVPVISMHGLRHTHASILLSEGISIAMIAKRLGHGSTATTQKVYLHIIAELESKDTEAITSKLCAF